MRITFKVALFNGKLITVAIQREFDSFENPIEITTLKIKFSIQRNVQSQRQNPWLLKDQTSETYDALLEFYAFW